MFWWSPPDPFVGPTCYCPLRPFPGRVTSAGLFWPRWVLSGPAAFSFPFRLTALSAFRLPLNHRRLLSPSVVGPDAELWRGPRLISLPRLRTHVILGQAPVRPFPLRSACDFVTYRRSFGGRKGAGFAWATWKCKHLIFFVIFFFELDQERSGPTKWAEGGLTRSISGLPTTVRFGRSAVSLEITDYGRLSPDFQPISKRRGFPFFLKDEERTQGMITR